MRHAVRNGQALLVVVTIGVSASSCDTGNNSGDAFVAEDSSGVVIATSSAPSWEPGDAWTLSDDPIVVMGGSDVGAELLRVFDYERAQDGSVAVLSAGLREIRVFNSRGISSHLVGGIGDGPGEFTMPSSLALAPPDTLLVLDRDAIEVFLLDGTWLESIPMRPEANPYGPGTAARPTAVAPDRSVLASTIRYEPGSSTPVGVYRPDQGYAVFPTADGDPVSLGWYGGIEQERIDVGGGTRNIVSPFARRSIHSVGVSSEERFLVADNARYEIQVFDSGGTLQKLIRREHDPISVRDRWIEDWKEAQRNMDWTHGQLPELERGWAQMTVNATLPAFESFTVDALGYVWVLRAEGEQRVRPTFDVFNREGRLLGEVQGPLGMRTYRAPLVGTDYFIGVWTDDTNVESVRIYELRGRG